MRRANRRYMHGKKMRSPVQSGYWDQSAHKTRDDGSFAPKQADTSKYEAPEGSIASKITDFIVPENTTTGIMTHVAGGGVIKGAKGVFKAGAKAAKNIKTWFGGGN